MWSRRRRAAALLATGALALAGCAQTGDSNSDESGGGPTFTTGFVGETDAGTDVVEGGSVTMGSYGFPATLDPTSTLVSGSTGGTELAAIYDTLVRYDHENQEYLPQLAASLDSSDDGLTWTVTLRDGTTFSDGTPMDAAAVKWSIDRYVAANRDIAQAWTNVVERIDTPDPKTVVFTLSRMWNDFPVTLSTGPGTIVAPSSEASGTFTPIGAGPFTVTRFTPNEALELAARDDYVGGRPHLDSLRFVPTSNSTALLESVKAGQLDGGYIARDTQTISDAMDFGLIGFVGVHGNGNVGFINSREGRPGADVRVRRAITLGVDPYALNQRANAGHGPAGSTMFPEGSRWHNENVTGVDFDPDEARRLLDEAKADGYDGKLTIVSINQESARNAALGLQAALNAVGFDVEIVYTTSVSDLTKRLFVDRDFDLVRAGANLLDSAPSLRLVGTMASDSNNNAGGYQNPEMDALLLQLQTAPDEAAQQTAIDEIQQLVNETAPFAVWGPTVTFSTWTPDLHGVKVTTDDIMLFDEAWLGT